MVDEALLQDELKNCKRKETVAESKPGIILSVIKWFLLITLGISFVVIICARIYFRLSVMDYFNNSTKAFLVRGLTDGMVPQGLEYDKRTDDFFVTGYDSNEPCSVYRINRTTGDVDGMVYLGNVDGSDFICHVGGVSIHNNYVYIAGGFDNCMYIFDYDEIMEAEDGAKVDCRGRFDLVSDDGDYLTVACMGCTEDGLIIAEFYKDPEYPTPESHKMTVDGGKINSALAVKFDYSDDENSKYGLSTTPSVVYSLPDKVQGLVEHDGKMYFSRSWGLSTSAMSVYSIPKINPERTYKVLGYEIPLIIFDDDSLICDTKIAPMSEEIAIIDGKIYTLLESASNKYVFGKLTDSEYCYATDLDFFK